MMPPSAIHSSWSGPADGAQTRMPGARPLSLDGATPAGNAADTPDDTAGQASAGHPPGFAAQVKAWRDARTQQRPGTDTPPTEILAMPGPFDLFQNPATAGPRQIQEPAQAARDTSPVQAQAGTPQPGTLQSVLPPAVLPPAEGVPQDDLPTDGPLQVVQPPPSHPQAALAQAVLPQTGLPQVGLPQVGLPQTDLSQKGLPQAVIPQAAMPLARMPQAAPTEAPLPEATQAAAVPKEMVKPWEMSSAGPMTGTLAQTVAPAKDAPETAQPRDVLAQSGALPADQPQSDAGTSALAKPFDLFHTLPMARLAETVDPIAMPATLDQSLVQMATRLLVSDGSEGRRQVQIEVAEKHLPGVVVDVFEEEGRIVTRFTCSDSLSRERLCAGATWLADNLVERLQRDSRVQVQTNDPLDPCLVQVDANA